MFRGVFNLPRCREYRRERSGLCPGVEAVEGRVLMAGVSMSLGTSVVADISGPRTGADATSVVYSPPSGSFGAMCIRC